MLREEGTRRRKDGSLLDAEITIRPLYDASGQLIGYTNIIRDITERKRAEDALRASEARLRYILSAADAGTWDWNVTAQTLRWSDENYAMHGIDPDAPVTPAIRESRLSPSDRERVMQAIAEILATGTEDYELEYRIAHPQRGERWILGLGQIERAPDGAPIRVAGINLDITERKQAEERQKLLMAEVDHRTNNILTLVLALMRTTRAATVPEFVEPVRGRIQALARAHALLASSRWSGASLRELVGQELAPLRGRERADIEIFGPEVALSPKAAQSWAMIIHELATNAVKHGVLAAAPGRLQVSWAFEDGQLALHWREAGRAAEAPRQRGVGLFIIEQSVTYELDGQVQFAWGPDGSACELHVPVDRLSPASGRRGP